MKIRKGGGGNLPDWQRSRSLKNLFYAHEWRGLLVARTWPRKRGKPKSNRTRQQNELFAASIKALTDVAPAERQAAEHMARNTAYTWRDILFMSMHGEYIELEGLIPLSIQDLLDTISDTPGTILYRNEDLWIGLVPPTADALLAFDVATHKPLWVDPSYRGITELTGDVLAGPGGGVQEATLSDTTVTPGSYTNANVTVDAKGRVTAAADGADSAGITELTGDVTAGPGTGSQLTSLSATGVVPGSYGHASITVDAAGRIVDADTGAVATSAVAGTVRPDGTTITVDGAGIISATTGGGAGGGVSGGSNRVAAVSSTLQWTALSPGLYLLFWSYFKPTLAAKLFLQFGYGATPTWDSGGHHNNMNLYARTGTNSAFGVTNFSTNTIFMMDINQTNTSRSSGSVFIDISNPDTCRVWGQIGFEGNDGNSHGMTINGANYGPPAQANAIQIGYDAGTTINSGHATLWRLQ